MSSVEECARSKTERRLRRLVSGLKRVRRRPCSQCVPREWRRHDVLQYVTRRSSRLGIQFSNFARHRARLANHRMESRRLSGSFSENERSTELVKDASYVLHSSRDPTMFLSLIFLPSRRRFSAAVSCWNISRHIKKRDWTICKNDLLLSGHNWMIVEAFL